MKTYNILELPSLDYTLILGTLDKTILRAVGVKLCRHSVELPILIPVSTSEHLCSFDLPVASCIHIDLAGRRTLYTQR